MEAVKQIITIISGIIGVLITAVGFLIPLIKNLKSKKRLIPYNELTKSIQSFIIEAEQFANYSGAEKKEFVMTKANRFALENGMPFQSETVSKQVEELVELSKEVNFRKKDINAAQEQNVFQIKF